MGVINSHREEFRDWDPEKLPHWKLRSLPNTREVEFTMATNGVSKPSGR
jgi:hypothetical protein